MKRSYARFTDIKWVTYFQLDDQSFHWEIVFAAIVELLRAHTHSDIAHIDKRLQAVLEKSGIVVEFRDGCTIADREKFYEFKAWIEKNFEEAKRD